MDDGTGHLLRPHSIIGMGAYGTVFKAFRLAKERAGDEEAWEREGKPVAVKQTIFSEVTEDITVVLKEVSYLSNLQHPNIVTYYTAFTGQGKLESISQTKRTSAELGAPTKEPGSKRNAEGKVPKSSLSFSTEPSLCIVEELVEGASVAKVIKMAAEQSVKQMTEAEIAAVVYDVLQALLYIHEECQLVHRDIKPLNMLLDRNASSVKLCDFGTCADLSQQDGRFTVIGTIGWIAPEVLDSGMMDHRSGHITSHSFPSDVWSLGVSALEMTQVGMTRSALSEYIKDLSVMPCSVQETVTGSRKSFLQEKLPTGHLRDFIACCLRRDPQIRPKVRQLLQHKLIVTSGVANAKERSAKIAGIIAAVTIAGKKKIGNNEKMNDEAIVLPQFADSTLTKNRCMEAVAALKREFFAAQAPLLETSRYSWCTPSYISRMTTSDDFRNLPKPPKLLDPEMSTNAKVSLPSRSSEAAKSLFDAVVVPATVESQRTVLNIVGQYRKLGGVHTSDGWADVDNRAAPCYTFEELACKNIKHETFVQLHDDLIRCFKACCMSIPDFEATFLPAFLQALTSPGDLYDVRRFIAYVHQLQRDDLRHTYHGRLDAGDSKRDAARKASCSQQQPPLPNLTAADWMRFPRMPQSMGCIGTSGNIGGDKSDTSTDGLRHQAPLVSPPAYLYNKWLKEKQARAMGPI
ncbi:protein kinase, putative [Trypanosoma equiperdum]|uniref:Protein kinase, putative n=1 Tax=Trypanosoma equiperdum TaxID=5694 RepID=A0A1G4HYG3_TRYEQ|nr:protein kinase, putative [Trypanosoma equiperdum]